MSHLEADRSIQFSSQLCQWKYLFEVAPNHTIRGLTRDIIWLNSLVEPKHASYEWNFDPFPILVFTCEHNFSILVSFFFFLSPKLNNTSLICRASHKTLLRGSSCVHYLC